jgi:hypothetical protein
MPECAPEAAFARSQEAFAQAEEWLGAPEATGLDHAVLEEQPCRSRRKRVLRAPVPDGDGIPGQPA